jgi:hypothetical protein
VDALPEATDADDAEILGSIPESVDFGSLVGADVDLDRQEAVLDLLLYARDRLRTDPGVNAFLAIDIDIPLEELDAATQSIEFALASNAVVYIVPRVGDNLGVASRPAPCLRPSFGTTTNRARRPIIKNEFCSSTNPASGVR